MPVYRVDLAKEMWVYADSEREAEMMAMRYHASECFCHVDAEEIHRIGVVQDDVRGALLYHDGEDDLTIEAAFAKDRANETA
jgi:hypothetical protein